MNWDSAEGNWKELQGRVVEKWGRLTHDEVDVIGGRREQLEGTLQRVYGKTKDEVTKEVDDFCKTCTNKS